MVNVAVAMSQGLRCGLLNVSDVIKCMNNNLLCTTLSTGRDIIKLSVYNKLYMNSHYVMHGVTDRPEVFFIFYDPTMDYERDTSYCVYLKRNGRSHIQEVGTNHHRDKVYHKAFCEDIWEKYYRN